jgi:serine/threonine-protein kinase
VSDGAQALPLRIQQYVVLTAIASGGMGTVHLGKVVRPGGFRRTVAIKRPHPHLLSESMFIDMLLDEARLTSSVSHPNVVDMIDVVQAEGEILLIMQYVHGLAVSALNRQARKAGERIPVPIAAAIVIGMLHGLHAAHEAKGASGQPLGIVHRDVSPQNVLVGIDGIPRVADFGIAKAADRLHSTEGGAIKGKLSYLAPEQFAGAEVTRKADIHGAGIVFWELLTGKSLYGGSSDAETLTKAQLGFVAPPSTLVPEAKPFDAIVLRALRRTPDERFPTAREMAESIEQAAPHATAREVGAWVSTMGAPLLATRDALLASMDATHFESEPPGTRIVEGGASPRSPQASMPPTVVLAGSPGNTGMRPAPTEPADVLSRADFISEIRVDSSLATSSRRRALILAVAIGATAATLALARIGSRAGVESPAPAPLAASTGALTGELQGALTEAPRPSPSAPASSVAEPAPVRPGLAKAPTASPIPSGAAPAGAVRPLPTLHAAVSSSPRASAAAGTKDCTPPYELDARGIKRYKANCL